MSARSLISLLLSRLARVLTVGLAATIKRVPNFGCAKKKEEAAKNTNAVSQLLQKQEKVDVRAGSQPLG